MRLPQKMMYCCCFERSRCPVISKDHIHLLPQKRSSLLLPQNITFCWCLKRSRHDIASQDDVLYCCLKRSRPAVVSKDFVLLLPRKMLSCCCLRKKNLERFRLCKTSNPTCTKNVMLRNIRLVEKNRLGPLAHVESSVSWLSARHMTHNLDYIIKREPVGWNSPLHLPHLENTATPGDTCYPW